MREERKYFILHSKSIAQALNFLGFEFYVFSDRFSDGKIYSFENTDKFKEAYKELCELRNKYINK
jgi:hypothetical protein